MPVKNSIDLKKQYPLNYKNIYIRLLEVALIDLVDMYSLYNPLYQDTIIDILFNTEIDDTKKLLKAFLKQAQRPTNFEYFLLYNQLLLNNHYIYMKTKGRKLADFKEPKINKPKLNGPIIFSILKALNKITWTNRKYKVWKNLDWGEIIYGIDSSNI